MDAVGENPQAEPKTSRTRYRSFVCTDVKVRAAERQITFRISTGAVDRDRDTLSPDGWQVDTYLKNPIVLWAHDSRSLPVGKCVSLHRTADGLEAVAQFATAEEYPFADTVYRLLKGGYINATSVGFIPIKGTYNEKRGGVDYTAQELIEFSIVPVPSNPEALVQARSEGLADEVIGWARKTLALPEPVTTAWASDSATTTTVVWSFDKASAGASAEIKSGRVLSAANRTRVQQARDAGGLVAEVCDELLAMDAREDDEKQHEKQKPRAEQQPRVRLYRVTPAAVVDAVKSAVTDAVAMGVRLALGRLD